MGLLRRIAWVPLALLGGTAVCLRVTLGGGEHLADPTGNPVLPHDALEVVADLQFPPGNIAVSRGGRIFFTFHPEGSPDVHVAELVGGKPKPYPSDEMQHDTGGPAEFQTPLALRIDVQNRLWVLDYGHYGVGGQPRLFTFDLATNRLLDVYDFPASIAGRFSMVNDFQVDPAGVHVYIAETSLFRGRPAIIVYDVENRTSRRVLEGHPSVTAKNYMINAAGRDMTVFGLVTLKIGVDSIGLDAKGEWLYYAPVSDDRMYRIATRDLLDGSLDDTALGEKVEVWGRKSLSDGISLDVEGNVYLSDMEHSAILQLRPDHELATLVKDERLRWPDGMSFGPDGWLYVTCSALHQVILAGGNAPYQIFRFRPGVAGTPGH
jgi:sugar lactone lactonase YvrE